MLNLAKVIHSKGFHITFVNTEFNHRRILKSRGGPDHHALKGLPDFRFEAIPDGLPPPITGATDDTSQDIIALCNSTKNYFNIPFRNLIAKLNQYNPPVTSIVSDGVMSFTLDVAAELGIPNVQFWTVSACGFMAFLHLKQLTERGLIPLKDKSDLETVIDWIPGMNPMRLRDLPSLAWTTDSDDAILHFVIDEADRTSRSSAIVLNSFHDMDGPLLDAIMSSMQLPPIHPIGPLYLLSRQTTTNTHLSSINASLRKEESICTQWLQGKKAGSVLYANFGSVAIMSKEQLLEFAWGMADSGRDFLWVIRNDLAGTEGVDALPEEFLVETGGRSLVVGWCNQEEVLSHPAVGGFMTYCGWNSTTESICAGVPMLCWGLFVEQPTNCRYVCDEWGVGMEVGVEPRREEVAAAVEEMMGGKKGVEMKRKVMEWKERAVRATEVGGASLENLDRLVEVLIASE